MVDWKELSELVRTRRSIRKFQDKPVPGDLLIKALELASRESSGGPPENGIESVRDLGSVVGSVKPEFMALTAREIPDLPARANGLIQAILERSSETSAGAGTTCRPTPETSTS